jgi:hypothetical protein
VHVKSLGGKDSSLYWSRTQEAAEQPRVKGAPQFTIQPSNVRVTEGETARFACAIVGVPRPKVHWFHNGKMATNVCLV